MIVYGIYNVKGGVGKTATSVNLAYLSGSEGLRTLLWDLDPQGSASFYYDEVFGNDTSLKKIISGKVELSNIICKTEYPNLNIIPADFSYRHIDAVLDQVKKSKKRIKEVLKDIKKDYDVVFIDCPPAISFLAENIFYACDFILVPTVPTTLSLRAYEQIISFFEDDELDKSMVIPFFSMVEMKKTFHRNSIEGLTGILPNVCNSYIPFLSDIEKMGVFQKPLLEFKPNSKAAMAYKSLWKELKEKTF